MPSPLSAREIARFARDAVEHQPDVHRAEARGDTVRAAKLRREHRLAARSLYAQAQQDVASSGFRVTPRVRDLLWAELERIAAEEEASPRTPVPAGVLLQHQATGPAP